MTVDNLVSFFLYLLISYLINKNHNPNIDSLNHYSGRPPNAPAPLLLPVIPNEPKNSSTFNFQLSTSTHCTAVSWLGALLFNLLFNLLHCCLLAKLLLELLYCCLPCYCCLPHYCCLLCYRCLPCYCCSLCCIIVHSAVLVPPLCWIAGLLFTPLYHCSFRCISSFSLPDCLIAVHSTVLLFLLSAELLFTLLYCCSSSLLDHHSLC